jgi:hypothetical protein
VRIDERREGVERDVCGREGGGRGGRGSGHGAVGRKWGGPETMSGDGGRQAGVRPP